VEENQRALEELLQRFKSTPIEQQVLQRVKAQGRASLVRRMSSNADLAGLLALYSASYGDWRKLFTALDDLNQVKAEDVQRAAIRYFVATGRTTVQTVFPGQSNAAPPPRPPERRTGGLQ
jgi:predicted Zn-dependent peptidase